MKHDVSRSSLSQSSFPILNWLIIGCLLLLLLFSQRFNCVSCSLLLFVILCDLSQSSLRPWNYDSSELSKSEINHRMCNASASLLLLTNINILHYCNKTTNKMWFCCNKQPCYHQCKHAEWGRIKLSLCLSSGVFCISENIYLQSICEFMCSSDELNAGLWK